MDVTKIGYLYMGKANKYNSTGYVSNPGNIQSKPDNSEVMDGITPHEGAVSIKISNESLERYMQEKFGSDYEFVRELDLTSFKLPNKDTVKTLAPKQEKPELIVKENFMEGSVEGFILNTLDGKVEDAYQLAKELGDMIWGYDNDDVKSRIIDREAAVKLAEYIAQNHFDNPKEDELFLDKINKYAKSAEMRDKGYIVFYNSEAPPIKPRISELNVYAEKYFGYTKEDLAEDHNKIVTALKAFQNDLINNPKRHEAVGKAIQNFDKSFDENEKNVQDIVDEVKKTMDKFVSNGNLFNGINEFYSSFEPSQSSKWSSVLELIKITD